MEITCTGYMPFDNELPAAPSDRHHIVWAKIDNYFILGKNVPFSNQKLRQKESNQETPGSGKDIKKILKKRV